MNAKPSRTSSIFTHIAAFLSACGAFYAAALLSGPLSSPIWLLAASVGAYLIVVWFVRGASAAPPVEEDEPAPPVVQRRYITPAPPTQPKRQIVEDDGYEEPYWLQPYGGMDSVNYTESGMHRSDD